MVLPIELFPRSACSRRRRQLQAHGGPRHEMSWVRDLLGLTAVLGSGVRSTAPLQYVKMQNIYSQAFQSVNMHDGPSMVAYCISKHTLGDLRNHVPLVNFSNPVVRSPATPKRAGYNVPSAKIPHYSASLVWDHNAPGSTTEFETTENFGIFSILEKDKCDFPWSKTLVVVIIFFEFFFLLTVGSFLKAYLDRSKFAGLTNAKAVTFHFMFRQSIFVARLGSCLFTFALEFA